jgi:hypothetical protein
LYKKDLEAKINKMPKDDDSKKTQAFLDLKRELSKAENEIKTL